MWLLPHTNAAGEFLTRPEAWGPWFLYAHAPHSYALIGAAIYRLLSHSSAVAPAHRRGLFLLVAAKGQDRVHAQAALDGNEAAE